MWWAWWVLGVALAALAGRAYAQQPMPVLSAAVNGQTVTLTWTYAGEEDDQCDVRRSTNNGPSVLIADGLLCSTASYAESVADGSYTYYLLVRNLTSQELGQSNPVAITVPLAATPTPIPTATTEPTPIPTVILQMSDIFSTTVQIADEQHHAWSLSDDRSPLLFSLLVVVLVLGLLVFLRVTFLP
jgi:hypothetical protein